MSTTTTTKPGTRTPSWARATRRAPTPGTGGWGIPLNAQKTHCNVLLQCAFWFDVIWVSESLQQPILCRIGVLPFCRVLISQPVYSSSRRHSC